MGFLKKYFIDWLIKDSVEAVIKAIKSLDGNKTSLGILGVIASGVVMFFGGSENIPLGEHLLQIVNALPKLTEAEVALSPVDVNMAISQLVLIGGIIGKVWKAFKGYEQSPKVTVVKG